MAPEKPGGDGGVYITPKELWKTLTETRDMVRDIQAAQQHSRRIWGWLGGGVGLISIVTSISALSRTIGV